MAVDLAGLPRPPREIIAFIPGVAANTIDKTGAAQFFRDYAVATNT